MTGNKKNKIHPDTIGSIGICLIIVSWIVALFVSNIYVLGVALGLIIVGIICVIYRYIAAKKEMDAGKEKFNENLYDFQNEYYNYANQLNVVKSDVQVTLFEGLAKIPQYIWVTDNMVNLFPIREYYERHISAVSRPEITDLQLRSIPIEDILYFEEVGELWKYTKVSGGGTSLKGALAGYILAGDVGAIIGSREPIKTEVISEDDRIVELIYKNYDGEIENLEFTHDAYAVLKKLVSEKELRRIINLK